MKTLRISPHKAMTLVWWWKNKEMIDFDPPYQRRGRLWSARDKAYLIDTIINGFDVPKLYMADFQFGQSSLNMTKTPYAIIDGKQRLEAVFDFFENKLVLNKDFKLRKDLEAQIGGLSLRDLRAQYPKIADDFENSSLDIMSVFAEDEEDIHEIFVRLNKSKPLTWAEVRNAVVGPVPQMIRTLAQHEFFQESIRFGVSRAGDLNAAAKVLFFEYNQRVMPTKKTDLDRFAREKGATERLELAGRRVIDTLNTLQEVFIPRDTLLSNAGIFPVYYWFVRGIDEQFHRGIREFLIWFEEARKKNRDRQKGRSGELDLDQKFSRFDTLNRSTNDLTSHSGRVEILDDYFVIWLNQSKRSYFRRNSGPAYTKEEIFLNRGVPNSTN